MTLLTTTVSVDALVDDHGQVVIHLVQGDTGTRRFQMIPISGGKPVQTIGVTSAHVTALSANQEPVQIDCLIEGGKIYMEPTTALVRYESEWLCQLVLLNEEDETLTSAKFTIIVHDRLFNGDTVEHTNISITGVEWDAENLTLTIYRADGTTIICDPLTHTHDLATASAAGFMAAEDKAALDTVTGRVNQDVRTTATPTFAAATIGAVQIAADGTVTGLKFT